MCRLQRGASQGRRTRWSALQVAPRTQRLRTILREHEDLVAETESSSFRDLWFFLKDVEQRGINCLLLNDDCRFSAFTSFGSAPSFPPSGLVVKLVELLLLLRAFACSNFLLYFALFLFIYLFTHRFWKTPAFENLLHAFCCVQTQSRPCLYT